MTANDITFGVEIECYVPAGSIQVGGYHNGLAIPGFPAGWNAQSDSSLGYRRGRTAVEVVSPVLKGVEGLNQVKEVVAKLNAMGASVSARCGFHVHVGFNGNATDLQKLTTLVSNHETAFFASTGTKNRERGSYCRRIREAFRSTRFVAAGERVAINGAAASNRYHVLNLVNLATGRTQTVEFRAFSGTLNFTKIAGYIQICVGMVQRAAAMKRPGNWENRPPVESSPINRKGGVGQTEMTRLFYQLGFTRGRRKETYGELTGPGLPTLKAIKRQLMRLAAKYDAQQ